MTAASHVGSLPGTAYAETVRWVLGELGEAADAGGVPALPELPDRGVAAGMTGRTLGLVAGELDADLQPAGWRLTGGSGAPGADQRRARSLLAQDLDALEEHADGSGGHRGVLKAQVAGPWTLAATVERPRGDRLLADRGARREVAQALAQAVGEHVADLRRRVPDATWWLQVDEPVLPAVLAGRVPTASGLHRHRTVEPREASEALTLVLDAARTAGAVPLVHCCDAEAPVGLLAGAGAAGVSVDLQALHASAYDDLARLLEDGAPVLLGVTPARDPEPLPTPAASERSATERAERLLDMLGLEPTPGLVLTPGCGMAGASSGWARRAVRDCLAAARGLNGSR